MWSCLLGKVTMVLALFGLSSCEITGTFRCVPEDESIIVVISQTDGFVDAYALADSTNPNCRATGAGNSSNPWVFTLQVGQCGVQGTGLSNDEAVATILLVRHPQIEQDTDVALTTSPGCDFAREYTQITVLTHSISDVNYQELKSVTRDEIVTLNMEDANSGETISNCMLGQMVRLAVALKISPTAAAFQMKKCEVSKLPGEPPCNLLTDSCPNTETGILQREFRENLIEDSNATYVMVSSPFKCFRFHDCFTLFFSCELMICVQYCEPVTCEVERRKRSLLLEPNSKRLSTVGTLIHVARTSRKLVGSGSHNIKENQKNDDVTSMDKHTSTWIAITLVVLLLVIVAFVLTAYLHSRLKARTENTKSNNERTTLPSKF